MSIAASDEAFLAAMTACRPRLLNLVLRQFRQLGLADAEDIVQDTFLGCWTHRASYEGRAPLYTWLASCAIRHTLMALRRQQSSRLVLGLTPLDPPDPASPAGETIVDLLFLLAPLTEQECAALLGVARGDRYADLARQLGLSTSGTKRLVAAARAKLGQNDTPRPPGP